MCQSRSEQFWTECSPNHEPLAHENWPFLGHKLKADRPCPRGSPHRPPDYRHTYKLHVLVMVLLAKTLSVIVFCCTQEVSGVPDIDRCVSEIRPQRSLTSTLSLNTTFDLDLKQS